mgnify:FL=1
MNIDNNTGATFSKCNRYRYVLWRKWNSSDPQVMFIGLNPSTADHIHNDPTISRCINYAKSWGYGGIYMVNIFSYKTTYPDRLKSAIDPIGKNTNDWIKKIYDITHMCIAAWGNNGQLLNRSDKIRAMLPKMHCLKITKSGEPSHPLYLKASLKPITYRYTL